MPEKLKRPLEMIAEWRKGCSIAGPACGQDDSPANCVECTDALVDALEKRLRFEMLDAGDRATVIECLRSWEKEARYTEADVGVFGSDAMGDFLALIAAMLEDGAPKEEAKPDVTIGCRWPLTRDEMLRGAGLGPA